MKFIKIREDKYLNADEIKEIVVTFGGNIRVVEKGGVMHDLAPSTNHMKAVEELAELVAKLNGDD